jgi:hypothetical protein
VDMPGGIVDEFAVRDLVRRQTFVFRNWYRPLGVSGSHEDGERSRA